MGSLNLLGLPVVCASEDCAGAKDTQIDDQGPNGVVRRPKADIVLFTSQACTASLRQDRRELRVTSAVFGSLLTHLLT